MVQFNQEIRLPTGAKLPNSDDPPVDNENQNFIPNLLLFLLKFYWNQYKKNQEMLALKTSIPQQNIERNTTNSQLLLWNF